MKILIKNIQVQDGVIKSGKNQGKPWKRYSITPDFKQWYSTFESDWGPNAHLLKKWDVGQVIDVEVFKDQKGYWKIQPPQKEEGKAPVPELYDFKSEIYNEITDLRSLVEERLDQVESQVRHVLSELIKLNENGRQTRENASGLPEYDEANPPPHRDEDLPRIDDEEVPF